MTYAAKLLDQRWQKKRLQLLDAAGWECRGSCENKTKNPTLHVHHLIYIKGYNPWEYEDWAYKVVCDECHKKEQDRLLAAHVSIARHPKLLAVCHLISLYEVDTRAEEVVDKLFNVLGDNL